METPTETPLQELKRKSEDFLSSISTVPSSSIPKRGRPPGKKLKTLTSLIGAKLIAAERDQFAGTPEGVYNELNAEFSFNFDPCPADATFDGLEAEWGTSTFVNPPFNVCKKWLKKAVSERKKGKLVVMLLPSRTGTKWFHKYVLNQKDCEIRFIRGYLTFQGYTKAAPFPLMIVVLKP